MQDRSVVIEAGGQSTPREFAERVGMSIVQVHIALAGMGKFPSPDQQMDTQTALALAEQLGIVVRGDTIYDVVPAGVERKADWAAFRDSVRRRHLRELYHFTPLENLPSIIAAGAVLSRRQMDERGIKSLRNTWGGSAKERTLGTDYICLSVTNQWKMLGRVMRELSYPPVVLVVAPSVIWYKESCFSPTNSASRDIIASQLVTWTDVAHFDALFPSPDAGWPIDVQAEVLVRDFIPLGDIQGIAFRDQDAFERAWELCGLDRKDPLVGKVCIKKSYYPNLEPSRGMAANE